MYGLELADGCLARRRATARCSSPAINAETVDRRASMPAGSAFLEKPFESADLLATVRSLLAVSR